ncbi:MAG: hypothetical protein K6F37_09680 [Lachnospiraceae bacterium]|nr:hypothetical protein [Lachnospiraceae bacterium]
MIFLGIVGILVGVWVANKVVDKMNEQAIRKLTYAMIGISGVINLI